MKFYQVNERRATPGVGQMHSGTQLGPVRSIEYEN